MNRPSIFWCCLIPGLLLGACSEESTSDGGTGAAAPSGGTGATAVGGTSGSGGIEGSPGGGATEGPTGGGGTATIPYAHVTAISASGSDGDYTFNVSVESADIDCSQFANWWEVLDLEGTLLFRRILEHCHTDANGTSDADAPGNTFTRSGGPVAVASDQVVIVRAHMSVGGYHGQVMRGSVEGGFEIAADIGDDFAGDVEDDEPQPTGCLF